MSTPSAEQVGALLKEVLSLLEKIESTGVESQGFLTRVEPLRGEIRDLLEPTAEGTPNPTKWATLSAEQQLRAAQLLSEFRDVLAVFLDSAEPTCPKSIMYRAHASNGTIIGVFGLLIVALAGLLTLIILRWPEAVRSGGPTAASPTDDKVLVMVILMGALGGVIHGLSSLSMFVGNRRLLRSWCLSYVSLPFLGAALAPLMFLLLRTGILAPPSGDKQLSDALNLQAVYAFAGLTGMFSRQAIEMLADVFSIVFKKVQAKDPLPEDSK